MFVLELEKSVNTYLVKSVFLTMYIALFPKWEWACSFLHLEDWFFQVTALHSWHASLNQSTHPLTLWLFPRCPGLGFGKEEMKDACLITQIPLILTLECSPTRTAFSWPSLAIEHWRITCFWSPGQINPHLISEVPGVRHGLCKADALYCCYYFRHQTRSF